jgi:hypothetical protein
MRATRGPYLAPILIEWTVIWVLAACSDGRAAQEETLSGLDSRESGLISSQYLLGDWNGARSYLSERGVRLDLQFMVSPSESVDVSGFAVGLSYLKW